MTTEEDHKKAHQHTCCADTLLELAHTEGSSQLVNYFIGNACAAGVLMP